MATLEAKIKHMEDYMKKCLHYTPLAGGPSKPGAGGSSKRKSNTKTSGGKKKIVGGPPTSWKRSVKTKASYFKKI